MSREDLQYKDGDRVNSSTDAEFAYLTTKGSVAAVQRVLRAWYREYDGEGFGNKAWAALERESNTSENQELAKRYFEEALAPLVASGEIEDVEIDTEREGHEMRIKVAFVDVPTGLPESLSLPPPWGDV